MAASSNRAILQYLEEAAKPSEELVSATECPKSPDILEKITSLLQELAPLQYKGEPIYLYRLKGGKFKKDLKLEWFVETEFEIPTGQKKSYVALKLYIDSSNSINSEVRYGNGEKCFSLEESIFCMHKTLDRIERLKLGAVVFEVNCAGPVSEIVLLEPNLSFDSLLLMADLKKNIAREMALKETFESLGLFSKEFFGKRESLTLSGKNELPKEKAQNAFCIVADYLRP